MKLTKEQITEIQRERNEGVKQMDLAVKYGVVISSIKYWTNEETRKRVKEQARNNFNKKSKEEKKKIYESRKEYMKSYQNRRYKTDSEFRKKKIEASLKWKKKQ